MGTQPFVNPCILKNNMGKTYKEDYAWICNGLFSTLYQVIFGEEAPCLSPKQNNLVKEYRDWYKKPVGVYIIISSNKKPPHWFPHFLPNIMFVQDMAYQTYVNHVVASLHRKKKGIWPAFPLTMKVCKIDSFKQAKDKVVILTFYKFREVTLRIHDPHAKLKEHLQQVGFIWSYSHEELLVGELIQQ
jgi:hypothetical protein